MKKTIISLSGIAVISTVLLATNLLEVSAATVGNTSSGANVAFQPKKTPTNPVSPGDGKTPITPTTPGVPNTSTPVASDDGLTLDYVPTLNFGTHYVDASSPHTWSAWAANDGSGKAIPQFMQVTDNRGTATGPTGWSVSLTQTAQFKGTKAGDLTNAVLTFNTDKTNNVVSTSTSKASSTVDTATNPLTPGTAVNIFQADAGTGTGTNLLSFGAADGSSLATDPESLDASTNTTGKVDPNITLSVPAGSAKVDTYTTTLNWNLYSAPGNA